VTVSDESVNVILQRLDVLAAKLGVTAQYIYNVYVHQAYVEVIRNLVVGTLFLTFGLLGSYVAKRLLRYATGPDQDDDWPFIVSGVLMMAGVLFIGIALSSYYDALGQWLNPQFWALDQLFKAVHQ
jgi:hypothetical protein